MKRIETDGSYWFFDEDRKTYVRTPKREGPREPPWDDEHAEALRDLTPHPYVDYLVLQHLLLILTHNTDPPGWVFAPIGRRWSNAAEVNAAMRELLERNR